MASRQNVLKINSHTATLLIEARDKSDLLRDHLIDQLSRFGCFRSRVLFSHPGELRLDGGEAWGEFALKTIDVFQCVAVIDSEISAESH